MTGVIEVRGLGKAYRHYPSRWGRLWEWIAPFKLPRHTLTWVLRDVSFSVKPGEVIGILGINGAGKSTLLKLLTGTTQRTAGEINISGRVAALLELGMGFHPDFTGRQNAVMVGQLLGLSRAEVESRFMEIEAFAELGSYFDEPLRVYSSGMQVRLAFSVATLIRPDILIVDEALSVGDAYFQIKSFSRIKDFKRRGTTILFVSHDVSSIKAICDRAILLSNGRIEKDDSAATVADYYAALITNRLAAEHVSQDFTSAPEVPGASDETEVSYGNPAPELSVTRSGTQEVKIALVRILGIKGEPKHLFFAGDVARVIVHVEIVHAIEKLVQGILIRDRRGNDIFGTNTFHHEKVISRPRAGEIFEVSFEFKVALGEGTYSLSVAAVNSDTVLWQNFDWVENIAMFQVVNQRYPYFIGVANLEASCTVRNLSLPHTA